MIDTNKLRISVLRLAFAGKLTQQFESDGNAADLLNSISPDKNIIQSENIPYSIPATWCWAKLSDVYTLNPKVTAEYTLESAFIPMEKISDGFSDKFTYDIQPWEKASKNHTKFSDGDVAFAKISPCFENRKSFIAHDLPNGIGGGTTELIILRQKEMDCEYTYYLVSDERFISAGSDSYRGIVGQQRVKPNIIKEYLIPVAPYAEQKRIVEKIKSVFELIDIIEMFQNDYISNLDALRKKVIEEGIKGNLTERQAEDGTVAELLKEIEAEKQELIKAGKIKKEKPLPEITEEEKPFEIPENWVWVRLGKIGHWQAGGTPSRLHKEYYSNGTIPWVKSGDLNDGFISKTDEMITFDAVENSSAKINPAGSVILAMYGATIGKTGVLNIDATTNQACCACKLYASINNRYLQYYLISQREELIGLGWGGAQSNISREKIIVFPFPLPPLAEQRRIVKRIEEVLQIIDNIND